MLGQNWDLSDYSRFHGNRWVSERSRVGRPRSVGAHGRDSVTPRGYPRREREEHNGLSSRDLTPSPRSQSPMRSRGGSSTYHDGSLQSHPDEGQGAFFPELSAEGNDGQQGLTNGVQHELNNPEGTHHRETYLELGPQLNSRRERLGHDDSCRTIRDEEDEEDEEDDEREEGSGYGDGSPGVSRRDKRRP